MNPIRKHWRRWLYRRRGKRYTAPKVNKKWRVK